MKTYADTSAVMSLFLGDRHASEARAAFSQAGTVVWTPWQKVEFGNALRALVCRQTISLKELGGVENAMRQAIEAGLLLPVPLPAYQLWQEAEKLSLLYTPSLGVRTLDLLHVAAARVLRCREFITCDDRQGLLVAKAGLHLVDASAKAG